jgi:signal transduction histidine kinase
VGAGRIAGVRHAGAETEHACAGLGAAWAQAARWAGARARRRRIPVRAGSVVMARLLRGDTRGSVKRTPRKMEGDHVAISILLVEDNDYDRELVCWTLQASPNPRGPVTVSATATWPTARWRLRDAHFDLILLDFNLPGPDGLQALRELAGTEHPPVIMLTGQQDVGLAMEMLRGGALEYVPKAGDDWLSDLQATITRVLDRLDRERERTAMSAEREAHAQHLEAETSVQALELAELARRAEEAAIVKAELLSNLSHELRTPLNVILGYAELLGGERGSDAAHEKLGRIRNHATELGRMIEALLDLKSLTAGTASLYLSRFKLADLVRELDCELREETLDAPVRITWALTSGNVEAEHDRERIRRIVRELLANAIKLAPGGHVHVTLGVTESGGLTLVVSDEGGGVPTELREPAFEDLRQPDGTPARRHGGLTLGLVRRTVTVLGGSIHVASALGNGTRVTVDLPPASCGSVPHGMAGWGERGSSGVGGGAHAEA